MKTLVAWMSAIFVGGLGLMAQAEEKTDLPLDRDFLVKAASCNNGEIEMSKLVDSRSNSEPVKQFAQVLIKDHKAAYDKLGDLVKNRKVGVAAGLEKETREDISRLSQLRGSEFDRAFLEQMVRGHKKAIAIFENQVKNGQDADLRDYAKQTLPDLRKHLKEAQDLVKSST